MTRREIVVKFRKPGLWSVADRYVFNNRHHIDRQIFCRSTREEATEAALDLSNQRLAWNRLTVVARAPEIAWKEKR